MRKLLIAALLLSAVGVAVARPGAIIIDDDGGGSIRTYVDWWNRVRDSGVPVRFRGMCLSACTLGLALPREQLCVEPTASFGFHLASDDEGEDEPYTQALIRRVYPPIVQKWLASKKLTLRRLVFMSAKEAVNLGVMPACSD